MNENRTLSWKSLLTVLFLEIFFVFVILAVFRTVPNKLFAARIASLLFVIQGALIVFQLRHTRLNNWNFTLPAVILFELFFVLPMALFRWFSTKEFSQFNFLGISGPTFHEWSSRAYVFVLAFTVLDLIVLLYRKLPDRE